MFQHKKFSTINNNNNRIQENSGHNIRKNIVLV